MSGAATPAALRRPPAHNSRVSEPRACQYLGCEDVAAEYVVIAGDPVPHDIFLCPGHAPYVRRAMSDASNGDIRVAAGDYGGERARVWVWKGQAG
jgi:hypothetical protein